MKPSLVSTPAVWVELTIVFSLIILSFFLFSALDFAEGMVSWLQAHEAYEVDEILPTALVALLLLTAFAVRRWIDANHQCERLIEAEKTITHLAYSDPLTGLPNRTLLLDRLQQAMHRSNREGCTIALVFLDLDGFKAVNDTLGHPIGDQLLQKIAVRLAPHVRDADTFGRLSGDEFALVLSKVSHTEAVRRFLERIHQQFQSPFDVENHSLNCTTSMGVAFYPRDAQSLSGLLTCADQAMYRAKADGKNSFRFFSSTMDPGYTEPTKTNGDTFSPPLPPKDGLYH